MPVMDEFKEEREALKHGTPKQKFTYFMDYYKWHVVICAAVIFMAVSLISQMLGKKDTVFHAVMINGAAGPEAGTYTQSFADYAGLDGEKNDILFDTSLRISMDKNNYNPDALASGEKLMVYIASGEVDAFVTTEDLLERYAYNEFFLDLRQLLTPEQLAAWEPYLYYVDQAVIREKNEAEDAMNYEYAPVYPDPRNPDAMEEAIPVGIILPDTSALRKNFYFPGENLAAGVVVNTKRRETVSLFLDFLLQPANQ